MAGLWITFILLLIIFIVLKRKGKAQLYYGVRGSLILLTWWIVGLYILLGGYHAFGIRENAFWNIAALPAYLSITFLEGQTHYMIIVAVVVGFGFLLGIINGVICNLRNLEKA